MKKPIVLAILDGVGLRDEIHGNAFKQANTPFIDSLFTKYPNSRLDASGEAVGLLSGIMGNSEVGHMNIGAGKIVYQPSRQINKEIEEGTFFKNENLNGAIDRALQNDSALHLLGLVSDAGVHSLFSHLFAIIDLAASRGVKKLYIHGFSDGRDTNPKSGIEFFRRLQKKLDEVGIGTIASVSGRYYSMDRDNRWDRIEKSYRALVYGEAPRCESFEKAILDSYDKGITDEFIEPVIIDENGLIKKGDVLIAFNFRPDRLRELFSAFSNPNFSGFERECLNLDVTTLMSVSDEVICKNAFKNQKVDSPLGVVLEQNNKTQLRIAETEKYAHVTFFFNGGVEEANDGEDRLLVPSPKVATYDLQPEMSAYELTDKLLSKIDEDRYDLIVVNYANPDMVGHTGVMEAAVKAVEAVDTCVGKVVDKILSKGGAAIITADHGNAEYMWDANTESTVTAHSTNPVPFMVVGEELKDAKLKEDGRLSDIAPTILDMMNLEKPEQMTGHSLIK